MFSKETAQFQPAHKSIPNKISPDRFPHDQFCTLLLHSITFAERVIFAQCHFCIGVTSPRIITLLQLHFAQSVLFALHHCLLNGKKKNAQKVWTKDIVYKGTFRLSNYTPEQFNVMPRSISFLLVGFFAPVITFAQLTLKKKDKTIKCKTTNY